jgi:hypothetical protein
MVSGEETESLSQKKDPRNQDDMRMKNHPAADF